MQMDWNMEHAQCVTLLVHQQEALKSSDLELIMS